MGIVPLLLACLIFLAVRSLARLSARFTGAGYKAVLLAGGVLAAALSRALVAGGQVPSLVASLDLLAAPTSGATLTGGVFLELATAWLFLMLALGSGPARLLTKPSLAGADRPRDVLPFLAAGLLAIAGGGLHGAWLLDGSWQAATVLRTVPLFALLLAAGSRRQPASAVLLLMLPLTLFFFQPDGLVWSGQSWPGQSWPGLLWPSLPLFLAAGLASFLAATWLKPANGGDLQRLYLPDALLLLSLACLTGGLACGLPAPAAGFLAGLTLSLGGRDNQAIKSRYKLLTELACDALAFAIGLGLTWPLNTDQLSHIGGILGWLLLPALPALLMPRLRRYRAWQFVLRLPSQAPAWALAAWAGQRGWLPEALLWSLALASLLSSLAPGKQEKALAGAAGGEASDALKVLVGLVDPTASATLVQLAARISQSSLPAAAQERSPTVHAVCVAEGPTGPQTASSAEDLLVRSVAAASQEGIRLIPVFNSANSPASGLLRNAAEVNADAIVIGWPRGHKDPSAPSVRDQLLAESRALLASVRNPAAFRTCRRVFLIVPPNCAGMDGFRQAMQAAGSLREQPAHAWTGVPAMELLTLSGEAAAIRAVCPEAVLKYRLLELPNWRDIERHINQFSRRNSAIILVSRRPDDHDWHPYLSQLADELAKSQADKALAVVYPSAAKPPAPASLDTSPTETNAEQLPDLVIRAREQNRIRVGMDETALVDAIHQLTASLFPGSRVTARRLAGEFFDSARKAPIELEPGMILLHAHVDGIKEPSLAIGSSQAGWKLVALQFPVNIVIVLCSPLGASPQVHLEALTLIAQALKNRAFLDSLLAKDGFEP